MLSEIRFTVPREPDEPKWGKGKPRPPEYDAWAKRQNDLFNNAVYDHLANFFDHYLIVRELTHLPTFNIGRSSMTDIFTLDKWLTNEFGERLSVYPCDSDKNVYATFIIPMREPKPRWERAIDRIFFLDIRDARAETALGARD